MSVCFSTRCLKNDAVRITKLDIHADVVRHKSWSGVETYLVWGQKIKVKVTRHKNVVGLGLCTLVSAGFFHLHPLSYSRMESKLPVYLLTYLFIAVQNSHNKTNVVEHISR